MALNLDVYAPCPCGSGKKLKFCCHAIAVEMEKVLRLQENHQNRLALQHLDALEKSHEGNAWIGTTRATILMSEGRGDEAKESLEKVLAANSDHAFATGLYATVSFITDGADAAKPAILRAFQRAGAAYPDLIGNLVMGVAAEMMQTRRFMSTRQYLTLAMRLAPEESRQDVFLRLLDFDSHRSIPYPLRGVHHLADSRGNEEVAKDAAKAQRLVDIGCYEPAARLFMRLIEKDPENAALWQNAGFCRAWDGDSAAAAEALHCAARLQTDRSTAVECETLAQLLELDLPENRIAVQPQLYHVPSVARLMTRLGEQDRLVRIESEPEHDHDGDEHGHHAAATYLVLDRPPPGDDDRPTIDSVPNVLAEIEVYDAHEGHDHPPMAYVTGFEGPHLDTARQFFEETVGDLAERAETPAAAMTEESIARDLAPLHWRWYFVPGKVPVTVRRQLEQEKWGQAVDTVWMDTPLLGLSGKTPREAAADPELHVPLQAAVHVLDAFCDQNNHALEIGRVYAALGLEPLPVVEVHDDLPLNSFSAMQQHRLPVERLSDQQLHYVLNRALLIHHDTFLESVLQEVLKRPSCLERVDVNRVYMTLCDICRDQNRTEEALHWVEQGRTAAEKREQAFETVLQWNLRELSLLLENPGDGRWQTRIRALRDYYSPKLPQIGTYLETMCDAFGVSPPWGAAAADVGSITSGGVWTPESPATEGERKLWIPGLE